MGLFFENAYFCPPVAPAPTLLGLRPAQVEFQTSRLKKALVPPCGQRLAADFLRNERNMMILFRDRPRFIGDQLPGRPLVFGGIGYIGAAFLGLVGMKKPASKRMPGGIKMRCKFRQQKNRRAQGALRVT